MKLSRPHLWLWVACLALLLPLLVYAYLGLFARYQADDFCYAWNSTTRTLVNAQTTWYRTDSSRFSATLVLTLSDRLGRWTVPLLPVLVLGLWLAGTYRLFSRLQKMLKLALPPVAVFFLAEVLIYFVLLLAPNLYQVLYWRPGLVIYLLPLALLTNLAAFLLGQAAKMPGKWRYFVVIPVILLFFFNAGFSETIATVQIGLLALVFAFVLWLAKGRTRTWALILVGSALLGSLLAMAALFFSPATSMRQGLIGPSPDLVSLVRMSLSNAFIYMYITLGENAFSLLLLLTTAMLTGYALFAARQADADLNPGVLIATFFLAPLVTILLTVCVTAPFAYGESAYPEGRVLINATLMLVGLVLLEGLVLGISLGLLQQRSPHTVSLALRLSLLLVLVGVSLFPLYSTRKVVRNDLPVYQQRAVDWDGRDAFIRHQVAQGQKDITATAFYSIGRVLELTPNPSNWLNGCAAMYYGAGSITGVSP
jgi:hypothetical protein